MYLAAAIDYSKNTLIRIGSAAVFVFCLTDLTTSPLLNNQSDVCVLTTLKFPSTFRWATQLQIKLTLLALKLPSEELLLDGRGLKNLKNTHKHHHHQQGVKHICGWIGPTCQSVRWWPLSFSWLEWHQQDDGFLGSSVARRLKLKKWNTMRPNCKMQHVTWTTTQTGLSEMLTLPHLLKLL